MPRRKVEEVVEKPVLAEFIITINMNTLTSAGWTTQRMLTMEFKNEKEAFEAFQRLHEFVDNGLEMVAKEKEYEVNK